MKHAAKRLLRATTISVALAAGAAATANETDTGQWSEAVDYIKSHGISVIDQGNGTSLIVLETALSSGMRPELRVRLGRDGVASPAADLGALQKITGLQVFQAPTSVNISDFNELHIWNVDAGVRIGIAPLKP